MQATAGFRLSCVPDAVGPPRLTTVVRKDTEMEPIFTLRYSEWLVAGLLSKELPKRQGYSIYLPLSRQEKGVDLLVTRRARGNSRTVTLQVKYSRNWEDRRRNADFRFIMSFNVFDVSEHADFYVLTTIFPDYTRRRTGARRIRWLPFMLLFNRREMSRLLSSLRTRSGRPEHRFYFSFNDPSDVSLTRGAPEPKDYSGYTLKKRLPFLRRRLGPS